MVCFDLHIKESEYETLFKCSKNEIKNFIIEFINSKEKREKKIKSGKKGIKIKEITKILNVRYSTIKGEKFDITNVVLNFINNNKPIENNKLKVDNLKVLTELTHLFNSFLHKYISFFCGRCEGIGHHKGIINQYLKPICKYKPDMLRNYFNDVEHGFFHGIMASFICYLINEDGKLVKKTESLEKIFLSATLHDFLKANGVEQKEHDKQLKNFFKNLCQETYVHSDPPSKFFKTHLIIADRLELRRYPDYKEWVDDRFYNLYKQVKPNTKHYLDAFYNTMRPALLELYTHRNSPFLRHGTEVAQEKIETTFPPSNTTYYNAKNLKNAYPIEIDMVPFCSYVNDAITSTNKWFNDNQNGYCSNHDGLSQWNLVKGFISINQFMTRGGKIIDSFNRDHLYATSAIPTSEWTFIYQNLDKKMNLKNVTGDKRYLESKMGIDPFSYLNMLIEEKYKVVSQETVFLFFQLVRMFTCRIVVLQ